MLPQRVSWSRSVRACDRTCSSRLFHVIENCRFCNMRTGKLSFEFAKTLLLMSIFGMCIVQVHTTCQKAFPLRLMTAIGLCLSTGANITPQALFDAIRKLTRSDQRYGPHRMRTLHTLLTAMQGHLVCFKCLI